MVTSLAFTHLQGGQHSTFFTLSTSDCLHRRITGLVSRYSHLFLVIENTGGKSFSSGMGTFLFSDAFAISTAFFVQDIRARNIPLELLDVRFVDDDRHR